jgi:hypothetical protein
MTEENAMLTRTHDRVALAALVTLFGGCAAPNVVVPIDTAQIAPHVKDTSSRVQVQVIDIRREANLERTTIGGISMGRITLQPPAEELVQAVVEAKADQVLASRGVTEPQTVQCGIRTFEVATPAAPLYWDVNAKIELVLRPRAGPHRRGWRPSGHTSGRQALIQR